MHRSERERRLFQLEKRDRETRARTAILSLPHASVPVPAFMPVGTRGAVRAMRPEDLEEMGYSLILGNTYHLYLNPGTEIIREAGGLHAFTQWKGNYLTDSGGFQIFSLASLQKVKPEGVVFRSHLDGSAHKFTPEEVVLIQETMGSDIQMPLDVCTPHGISESEAREALTITTTWGKRALGKWREAQERGYRGALFGIVQGNFFRELRKQSAEEILALETPGIAIGGLSVGEPSELFYEYLAYTAELLPEEKPRYVLGIGTPDYILAAVESGIDLFDCVYPTRVARNGTCFTRQGLLPLKNSRYRRDQEPIDSTCSCRVCSRFSRSYLRHLFKAKEILGPMLVTYHNLFFFAHFLKEIRQSIRENAFLAYKKTFLERYMQK